MKKCPKQGFKFLLMNWMIYWPLSAFWTLINNPVKRAFKGIFTYFEKQYQVISDKVFNGMFEEEKEK